MRPLGTLPSALFSLLSSSTLRPRELAPDEIQTALGRSEEAVKRRVHRAVEKLRDFFARRGVVVSGAALMSAMAANSVQAAPTSLAHAATTLALAKGATGVPLPLSDFSK